MCVCVGGGAVTVCYSVLISEKEVINVAAIEGYS